MMTFKLAYDGDRIMNTAGLHAILHRLILDPRDFGGQLLMLANLIEAGNGSNPIGTGGLVSYRDTRNGRMVFGLHCGGCDAHHRLLEIDTLDTCSSDMIASDRFVGQTRGAIAYSTFLDARNGELLDVPPSSDAQVVIEMLEDRKSVPTHFNAEFAMNAIFSAATSVLVGDATLMLDLETGRTAIGTECRDCEKIHPQLLIGLASCQDLRDDPNLAPTDNPFLGIELPEFEEEEQIEPVKRMIH